MLTRREALSNGAALLASVVPSISAHAAASRPITSYDRRIRLRDGRLLGYREHGENHGGPLVFYFHGTPGSRLELELCAAESRESGARVVAVDRPGIGLSSHDGNRRITDWPRDIEQLAAALGHADAPFGIIGLSGGAPYAAACARQIPHRLTHVALVSGHTPLGACGTCPGNADKVIALVTRRPRLGKLGFKVIGRRLDRKPDKVVQKVTENWTAADKQLILCNPAPYRQLIANLKEADRCGPAGLAKDIQLLGSPWGFRVCDITGVPVSIWQGDCDRIVHPSMGRYFHQQIAGSELLTDPRAGHVTMFKWHAREILAKF